MTHHRYLTVATCVEDGCRCLDRRGVVLYDGPSPEEAVRAKDNAPPGYRVALDADARDRIKHTCPKCDTDHISHVPHGADAGVPKCPRCGTRLHLLTREPETREAE